MNLNQDTRIQKPKVVLLGRSGVGKTALATRLSEGRYRLSDATHGLNTMPLDFGTEFPSTLIDLPTVLNTGIEEELIKTDFSIAVVVVYAHAANALEDAKYWSEMLDRHPSGSNRARLLVVSMSDVGANPRQSELKELAKVIPYTGVYETSAMSGQGIEELQSAISGVAKAEYERQEPPSEASIILRTVASELCRLIARDPTALDEIAWLDLERVLAEAFDEFGFSVKLTPPSKDGGKDVIVKCMVGKDERTYYVEIKHWRSGKRTGYDPIRDFVEVTVRDNTHGGLFVSTSGYTPEVYSRLAEISQQRVRLGGSDKVISLCQTYVRKKDGLWKPDTLLPELLFERTL